MLIFSVAPSPGRKSLADVARRHAVAVVVATPTAHTVTSPLLLLFLPAIPPVRSHRARGAQPRFRILVVAQTPIITVASAATSTPTARDNRPSCQVKFVRGRQPRYHEINAGCRRGDSIVFRRCAASRRVSRPTYTGSVFVLHPFMRGLGCGHTA